jgi:hypothetical protein
MAESFYDGCFLSTNQTEDVTVPQYEQCHSFLLFGQEAIET